MPASWIEVIKRISVVTLGLVFLWNLTYSLYPASFGKAQEQVAPSSSLTAPTSPTSSRTHAPSPFLATIKEKSSVSSSSSSSSSSLSFDFDAPIPENSIYRGSHEFPTRPQVKIPIFNKPVQSQTAPTWAPHLLFPPDNGGTTFDLNLDVRPENDVLLAAQSIPEMERISRLQKWLQRNGARFNGFEFRQIAPEYRGLFATQDLPQDFEFIFVPSICMLDAKHFNTSIIGQLIHATKTDFKTDEYAIIFYWWLLIERFNPNSFWRFWIATLPLHYKTIPRFWSADELSYLNGSIYLNYRINAELDSAKQEYQRYTELIPALKAFSLEQYNWATVAVGSRVWSTGGADTNIALMDMINHNQPEIHLSHNWLPDGSSYTTTKAIPKGSQLYFHYGARGQTDWFLHYGFTTPQNQRHDYTLLYVSLDPADPLIEQKTLALGYATYECYPYMMYKGNQGHWCYSGARARVYKGSNMSLINEHMEPTSLEEEVLALQYLAQECNTSLRGFPTTYDQDQATLKDEPSLIATNFNYYNALVVRTSEKRILHHYIQQSQLLTLFHTEYIQFLELLPAANHTRLTEKRKEFILEWLRVKVDGLEFGDCFTQYFRHVFGILFPETKPSE